MKHLIFLMSLALPGIIWGEPAGFPEYFTLPGCHDCEEIFQNVVEPLFGGAVKVWDVLTPEGYERALAVCQGAGIAYPGTPFLRAGERLFYGEDLREDKIKETLYRTLGEESPPEKPGEQKGALPRMEWGGVVLAGLLDGVNPCAMTTLLFLLSALAWGNQSRSRILLTGFSFLSGVFFLYFFTGLGLLQILTWVQDTPAGSVLRWTAAAGAGILGLLSLRDGWMSRRGETKDLVLKLPGFLQALIRTFLRSRGKSWLTFLGSFTLGVVLSALEFVCTGQVYLPTLTYMAQQGNSGGLVLLFLYNLAFLVPLGGVFLTVWAGLRHEKLVKAVQNHLSLVKYLLGVLLLGLGGIILF